MCNLSDGVEAHATFSHLKALMKTMNLSIDEALAAMEIQKSQYEMYRDWLGETDQVSAASPKPDTNELHSHSVI